MVTTPPSASAPLPETLAVSPERVMAAEASTKTEVPEEAPLPAVEVQPDKGAASSSPQSSKVNAQVFFFINSFLL